MSAILKNLSGRLGDFLRGLKLSEEAVRAGPQLGEDGILRANGGWKPQAARRRVEIMVTGDPSRVATVSDAVDDIQKEVFGSATKPENLELRITAFLDGCIHRSKWNKKPFKAAAEARKWECEQSKTRFADAFADSHGELVDTLVIVGHRFDENIEEALKKAEELKQQGVRIHCFHTGKDEASRAAYEKLATETDGVFLQLTDQSSIANVIPIIMAHENDERALLALNPKGNEAKKLMSMLMPDRPATLEAPDED